MASVIRWILDEKIPYRPNRYFGALINLEEYIRAESSFFNPGQIPTELKKDFEKIEKTEINKISYY